MHLIQCTLAAVTPDRTPYPKLRNAFGVNRRETFWRSLCWDTDFEGMDKQDLAVELCLIFFCATMTSLTRAKTEYNIAYRVLLFILKRSIWLSLSKINSIHMQKIGVGGVHEYRIERTVIELFSAVTTGFALPNPNRGNKR